MAHQNIDNTEYVWQWGVNGKTIDNPYEETLQHFLDRKNLLNPTKEGVRQYLTSYKATDATDLEFFTGTRAELATYKIEHPIIVKADKGQEAENAIELNDAIKYYIKKLIRDNDFDIKSDLFEIALDNTNIAKQTKFQNDMKTRRAYIRMLNNVEEFERSIAIATNSDPSHPVSWVGEKDFVNILSHMAIDDKPRYAEITKLLNVEATYEPEALKDEYIKLQQIVNSHIVHPTPTVDGHTLASELPVDAGGTQTK